MLRIAGTAYSDGVGSPSGADRPGAREVSNAIAAHPDVDLKNDRNLTALVYAWGQFLDHDLDLTSDGKTPFPIPVPAGDPQFDPLGAGSVIIPFSRAATAAGTGTDPTNPLQHLNSITAFLDGSQVYGSDATRAAALRTFTGGKLKTSGDGLLPRNVDGLANDNIPGGPAADQLFLAGDVRANENIELTSLQTLFMREHNRLAELITRQDPRLTDEQIYQKARRIVIAEMQSITNNEFLPALIGVDAMPAYGGYDRRVNPGISAEFSMAAYRLGHTMVGNDVEFLDNDGNELREALPLSQAFFSPNVVAETGIDPIIKYLATDLAEEVDTRVVDGLRNMLFGPPGAGGLDLAAINIQRGRDLGLADYNTTRAAFGLPRITSFSEITTDADLQVALESLYGSVDRIDLWAGGLAEDHLPGSSVGPTFTKILVDQFDRLRAGDRFWYENVFRGQELNELRNTTLKDVIERNTSLTNLQSNVFYDPSVLYYKIPEGAPTEALEIRIDGTTVQIFNVRSGSRLATADVEATSQVIVIGSDSSDDKVVLNIGRAATMPSGGITLFGGRRGPDELVVLGTSSADHFKVISDQVHVNGSNATFRGFEKMTVIAGVGDDMVTVEPTVRIKVVVRGSRAKIRRSGQMTRILTFRPGSGRTGISRIRLAQGRDRGLASKSRSHLSVVNLPAMGRSTVTPSRAASPPGSGILTTITSPLPGPKIALTRRPIDRINR